MSKHIMTEASRWQQQRPEFRNKVKTGASYVAKDRNNLFLCEKHYEKIKNKDDWEKFE